MNYEDRDTLGIYKVSNGGGPGPDASAETLKDLKVGNRLEAKRRPEKD